MAFSELEERISKIRQQNEEIKRRYEEVEEDKKNAAKLNALVQMVPSTDWPERKEPPEYSNLPKVPHKQKPVTKEQSEQLQHYPNDRKKGEGPPPDPKYNFLADAEREEYNVSNTRDNSGNKSHNKSVRGNFKKRGTGREGQHRGRMYHGTHRDEHKPEYEAWRKERNRIDEDRISRQKTAEGNWRREWDNDKAYLANEISKAEGKVNLGDFTKKDHKDGRHSDGNGYTSHNRGAYHKSYRGSSRNFHNNHDYNHHMNSYDQHSHDTSSMNATAVSIDERTVIATDKSIKVTLNQSTITKGPVMSVKVNSPSIAGTGRVGPRQRSRVTYSSHSDVEANTYESGSFSRQKSFEDKTKGTHFNNTQKTSGIRRPQFQKKKENDAKSPYSQRKDYRKENSSVNSSKHYENGSQQNFARKDYKDNQKFHYPSKSPRASHKKAKMLDIASQSSDTTNECSLKNEKTVLESGTSIESPKINTESPTTEVIIDENSVILEEQAKTDIEENNEIPLEHSESSSYNREIISEEIETLNYDVNVSSTTDPDNVSISENKNIDEEIEKNKSSSSSHIQDINNDVGNVNDEKGEVIDSTITIDNPILDSCISDNNRNILDDTAQAETVKTELIQEDVFSTSTDKLSEEELNKNNDQNDIAVTTSEERSDVNVETSFEELSTNTCAMQDKEKCSTDACALVKEELTNDVCAMVKEELPTDACALVKEELSTDICTIVKEELPIDTSTTVKGESSTDVCAIAEEELPISTCVIVKEEELSTTTSGVVEENDATCHDNKVPVKENILPVDDTNKNPVEENVLTVDDTTDNGDIPNSTASSSTCIDKTIEHSSSEKTENHNETTDNILKNAELKDRNNESVIDEKHDESEIIQTVSEKKEN